eukprot:g1077.t1
MFTELSATEWRIAAVAGAAAAIAYAVVRSSSRYEPSVTLWEFGTTRSARCRWTLLELGQSFRSISARPHQPEVLALNPSGKLPIAIVDGVVLTESAAICTHLADRVGKLVGTSGSIERAHHDRWVSFALAELDAWLWHSYISERFGADAIKAAAPVIKAHNSRMWKGSVRSTLEPHLRAHDYLVSDVFSCADIVVAWSLNWGRRAGVLDPDEFPATHAYLARLLARPLCALNKD